MRVAFINSHCDGSTGSICSSIASYLTKEGHEVKFFYGRFPNEKNPAIYVGGSTFVNLINNVRVYVTGNVGSYHKGVTKELIKQLTEFNPDVIHIHNIHCNYLDYEMFFNYLSKFDGKVVMTLHDQFMITGHCAVPMECKLYLNGCKECPHKDYYPHVLSYKGDRLLVNKKRYLQSIKHLTIVTPSNWLNDIIGETYMSKFERVVINNGIDLPSPNTQEKQRNEKIRLLFAASPWASYKGPNDIVELSRKLDITKYELIVVGKLDKSFKEFPLPIKYLGQVNKDTLQLLYQEADLFIDPTYQDNFPTVLIEAIANGLPCICYDTGGCKEIVTPEVGIIVKERTPDALIEAIRNFDFTKFDKNIIVKQASKFTKEEMIKKYIDVYGK